MTTTIHSNGSKWGGEQPDDINALVDVLGNYALDRTFEDERFGNFVFPHDKQQGITCFFGNFADLSHVFSIDTDDAEVIARLTTAIRANQQRPDYLSQKTYPEVEAERAALEHAKREAEDEKRKTQARAVLGLEAA